VRVIDALEPHKQDGTHMASSGKKKTTMAKLTRESRLRERRAEKQAKKVARKLASADHSRQPGDELGGDSGQPAQSGGLS
jgi:hypothetical protein